MLPWLPFIRLIWEIMLCDLGKAPCPLWVSIVCLWNGGVRWEREPKAVSKTFWFSSHTALKLLGFTVNFPLVYITSSQLEYTRMLSSGVDRDRGQLISLVHPLCYRHTAAYVVGTQLVLVDWTWWGHTAFRNIRSQVNKRILIQEITT